MALINSKNVHFGSNLAGNYFNSLKNHKVLYKNQLIRIMPEDLTFCSDDISDDDLKTILKTRNQEWIKRKDGSNTINCSLKAVVVSCIDSRVPVENIFQAKPGELLVLKNAGNIITTDMVRSILVAIYELKVRHVIIMGHTECGMAIRDDITKMDALKQNLSPALINKIQKSEQKDVLNWFGFFNYGEWVENAQIQKEILQNIFNDILPSEFHPSILVALYDLQSGNVDFLP